MTEVISGIVIGALVVVVALLGRRAYPPHDPTPTRATRQAREREGEDVARAEDTRERAAHEIAEVAGIPDADERSERLADLLNRPPRGGS